jgi:hypothetical protein
VSDSPPALSIGFLSIFQDPSGHLGGYLVTNGWGRPLEFRLTSAIQPNRVQSVLYGSGLTEYVQCELIGKTLIEKTATQPVMVVADSPAALNVRKFVSMPVIAVSNQTDAPPPLGAIVLQHPRCRGSIYLSAQFESDRELVEQLLNKIDTSMELIEPFNRVREAMNEARRMGVAVKAAA